LTIQKESLGLFAFLLFDTDHTGSLDAEEMVELIYTIHNIKNTRQKTIGQVVEKLRANKDIFTEAKFEQWIRSHMSLMEPVQILQRNLRQHIIGEKFWGDLTDTRSCHPEFGEVKHIERLKIRAIEIRQNQIRDLHLKKLQSRNEIAIDELHAGAGGGAGAKAGPGRGMGRRTTSMLRFFGLADEHGNMKHGNKKAGGGRKVMAADAHLHHHPTNDSPAPPPTTSPQIPSGKHKHKQTPPAAQIADVMHLPMKARRRRSSLFGRPDLRRIGDTKSKPTKGKRAIRKRRRQKTNGEGGFAEIGEGGEEWGGEGGGLHEEEEEDDED
jgi:hypothetical protein